MFTLSINDRLSAAQETALLLRRIDPGGIHIAEADPVTVLEMIRDEEPDVILIDTELPPVNKGRSEGGINLARNIRSIAPDANIIFTAEDESYAYEALKLHASGYIINPPTINDLKQEIASLRRIPAEHGSKRLRIQCFGNFEVFHNGKAFRFSRSLSKEALAYLVDRRGAGCTVGEICAVLWEDRSADTSLKSQCRVIMASLRKDLEEIGAQDVLVKTWNTWSVDPTRISCDYFDYIDGRDKSSFRGEYMSQYSWAELTMGILVDESEDSRIQNRKAGSGGSQRADQTIADKMNS